MSQHQKAMRLADELMQAHKGHAGELRSMDEAETVLRAAREIVGKA